MVAPHVKLRRHPERTLAVPDDAEAILARALVAHAGFVEDGYPYVIPFTFLYRDGAVYLHGSPGSRAIRRLASGEPVCVEVTLLDALIASKSAETHSVNYRSVVCFGRGRMVEDEHEQRERFQDLIGRYFPGRTAGIDYADLTEKELKGVRLVKVELEAMSAKGRFGGPLGPLDDDPDAPGNAGIVRVPASE
jgi:nitroimidazol reductase NimA-like FMN-containing flavoprotein (pyridoxamine 5'-phosphate oxidase superfamily)